MITCDKPCVCGILSLSLWVVSPLLLSVLIMFDCLLPFADAFAQSRLFIFAVIPSVMIIIFFFFAGRGPLFQAPVYSTCMSVALSERIFSVLKGSFSRSSLFSFLSDQTPPPLLVCPLLLISAAGS